jgi:hypothetical protein
MILLIFILVSNTMAGEISDLYKRISDNSNFPVCIPTTSNIENIFGIEELTGARLGETVGDDICVTSSRAKDAKILLQSLLFSDQNYACDIGNCDINSDSMTYQKILQFMDEDLGLCVRGSKFDRLNNKFNNGFGDASEKCFWSHSFQKMILGNMQKGFDRKKNFLDELLHLLRTVLMDDLEDAICFGSKSLVQFNKWFGTSLGISTANNKLCFNLNELRSILHNLKLPGTNLGFEPQVASVVNSTKLLLLLEEINLNNGGTSVGEICLILGVNGKSSFRNYKCHESSQKL